VRPCGSGEQCSTNSLLFLETLFGTRLASNKKVEPQRIRLCPKCGGVLYRVPPRLANRLFSPGHCRFQCESQECSWIGNLPIEGTHSRRFGLVHGLVAGSIVVIVASVLGLSGLFTIYRERAEVAASHNLSPSDTPSVMIVDHHQKAEEAFSDSVGHIGRPDVLAGAPKGTDPAGAAPELPVHPVAVLAVDAMPEVLLQPNEALPAELSPELIACIKASWSSPTLKGVWCWRPTTR
jgi:hypothetical protein